MTDAARGRTRTKRAAPVAEPARRSTQRIVIDPSDMINALMGSRERLSREEMEYLAKQPPERRDRLLEVFNQSVAADATPLRFRVVESRLPGKADILARLAHPDATGKYQAWVAAALQLPIGRVSPRPVRERGDVARWLADARRSMDEALWGQHRAKDEAVRMLCQWASAGSTGAFAIGLKGMPGIGKTCFAQSVLGRVMARPFTCIGLGGAQDS